MHARSTRFLLDTNVFIAAAKKGWTTTTDLVLRLVEGDEDLIANEALTGEYRKYAGDFGDYGMLLFDQLSQKAVVLGRKQRLIPAFSKAGYSPYLSMSIYTHGDHTYISG